MAMEFHLYRTKFIKPAQSHLFTISLTAREFFEKSLAERPSLELREHNVWHIGNIEYFTESAGRFAVGRTTKTTVEKFDPESGNFTEQTDDSGPYTYVYFDSTIGLFGIGKKAKVANDVKSIARNLQRLLAKTELVQHYELDVRVEFIPDPKNFIEKIYSAYAIKKFKAYFTGPNPIDADELFQRPMSYYCQKLNGYKGSVVVTGEKLDDDAIVAVAKSTAATANSASALIQTERGTRPVSIAFKGDAVKVVAEVEYSKERTLSTIQQAYKEIRG